MTLPTGPIAVQCNWSDTNAWNMWDQANANYLGDCPHELRLMRQAGRPSLGEDTLTLVVEDAAWWVVPGKADSPLYPHVQLGRRVRVLEQVPWPTGTWTAQFFGYLTEIEPIDRKGERATVRLVAESPLRVLARQPVTLPALPAGNAIYQAATPDGTALYELLRAAGVSPLYQDIADAFYGGLTADWDGRETTVGEALAQLAQLSGAVYACEPQYATASGQPDWLLSWRKPGPADAAAFTWSAPAGDIEGGSQVTFSGELP